MSLTLDLQTLHDRFNDQWDAVTTATLFMNAPAVDVVETEPFVRFSVTPGDNFISYGGSDGGVYTQLGRAWLQIFVPVNDGDATAFELADAFTAIFRNWKSADGCLRCLDHEINTTPDVESTYLQINVSIRWESLRRL